MSLLQQWLQKPFGVEYQVLGLLTHPDSDSYQKTANGEKKKKEEEGSEITRQGKEEKLFPSLIMRLLSH